MEFKGTQGKLNVEIIEEDFYVHLINEKGNSVCSISTTEEQMGEALIYATLFSKAPEMLEMLNKCLIQAIVDGNNEQVKSLEKLIKEATEL